MYNYPDLVKSVCSTCPVYLDQSSSNEQVVSNSYWPSTHPTEESLRSEGVSTVCVRDRERWGGVGGGGRVI